MGPMGNLAAIPGDVAYGGELGNGGIMVDSAARRAERRVMELLDPGESDRITGQPGVADEATVPATCCVDRGRWGECSVDDACSVHDVDSLPYRSGKSQTLTTLRQRELLPGQEHLGVVGDHVGVALLLAAAWLALAKLHARHPGPDSGLCSPRPPSP